VPVSVRAQVRAHRAEAWTSTHTYCRYRAARCLTRSQARAAGRKTKRPALLGTRHTWDVTHGGMPRQDFGLHQHCVAAVIKLPALGAPAPSRRQIESERQVVEVSVGWAWLQLP